MLTKKQLKGTGIYRLINRANGQFYIGSAAFSFSNRRTRHFKELIEGNHPNKKLQNAFNKYGESAFEFEILAICPPEYCLKLEQWFLDTQRPQYNIYTCAKSPKGMRRTDASKHLMRVKKSKWHYTIQCPDGTIEQTMFLSQWCEQRNLEHRNLRPTLEEKRTNGFTVLHHKGYCLLGKDPVQKPIESFTVRNLTEEFLNTRRKKIEKYNFTIQDRNGNLYETRSLNEFCKTIGLVYTALSNTLPKELGGRGYNHHHGYRILSKTPLEPQTATPCQ